MSLYLCFSVLQVTFRHFVVEGELVKKMSEIKTNLVNYCTYILMRAHWYV